MRLLAIDPGSHACATAMFVNGKLKSAVLAEYKAKDTWEVRMKAICAELLAGLGTEAPDVIVMERVVAHRNIAVLIMMAKTLGYLTRALSDCYPKAEWHDVPKADVCHALGIKGNATRQARQDAAREAFPLLDQQDLADAAAVGLGYLEKGT